MKRNVLHLIGTFEMGGTERQAVQLSRLLKADATYKVFLGCLDANGPLREEAEGISEQPIPEFRLNSFYDVNFWTQIRRCIACIKKWEIGIIHTHDFYTNIFGMMAAFTAAVPVRIASKRNTFSKTRNQMLVERQAFRVADRILVNGDAVSRSLVEKGVPENKIVRVYNAVDLDRFETSPGSEAGRNRNLELKDVEGKKIVTIVANLRNDVKNHEMFLRTAARIKAHIPEVAFVIAGEGELMGSLQRYADELGLNDSTHFVGRCEDIHSLLSASDVCMLTSRSEGFPNSILEYMAVGKPVVATNVGAVAELVADGESGFLVSSDDDSSAADRVMALLKDPQLADRFGSYGRQLAVERFSLSAQLNQILELYDALLRSKRQIKVRERI